MLSSGLKRLRQKALQRKHGVTFEDEEGKTSSPIKSKAKDEGKRPSRGIFQLFKDLLKFIGNLLLNSKFSIDELINIARPVIYLYSILRFGRRSFRPLKISLMLDIV